MTVKQFRENLLAVIDQATAMPSNTNSRLTKGEIHRRLIRQTINNLNEDIIHASYVRTFNQEFTLN